MVWASGKVSSGWILVLLYCQVEALDVTILIFRAMLGCTDELLSFYLHDHFPQLAESFSAMYIRNVSRQSGLDLLSHFQQPNLHRPKPSRNG
jgi:hypothetical protein